MRHLVIPDAHAHPDFNNDRFSWLGNLIVDLKPDHVVCIGDFADMPSLCSYEKGTKGFEGRRYKKDIDVTIEAQERMFAPINKRKKKKPKFWMLIGNHEHRINRAISADAAQLDGIISLDDLAFRQFGWKVVPYSGATPGHLELSGVRYAHYFTTGVMGRPISGLHPAATILLKQFQSATQGHIHTTDFAVRTRADGQHLQGLVCGCYIDYFADFAGEANKLWWSGVVVKDFNDDGTYDPRWISIERIRKEYGNN